jgi:hypothetical protein
MMGIFKVVSLVTRVASHLPVVRVIDNVVSGAFVAVAGGLLAKMILDSHALEWQINRNHAKAAKVINSYDLRLKFEFSKRSKVYLEQLALSELEEGLDIENLEESATGLRVAFKYSRRARLELRKPSYSAENESIVHDRVYKMMKEDGLRPSQIIRHLHKAVTLTFVRDIYELEDDSLRKVLRQTDRWDASARK